MALQARTPKETVVSFVNALNTEDFKTARGLAHENMTFTGILGSRHGAESYFRDMEHLRLKYDIKKVFADGEDVCLLYDLGISGIRVFCCGWYRVENGKIISLRVIFDPRPVLELSK